MIDQTGLTNWRTLASVVSEVIERCERAFRHAGGAYNEYLRSEEWQAKRAAVMQRCGALCESCHNARAVQIHHMTYDNLFHEPLTDLKALCNACHEAAHEIVP